MNREIMANPISLLAAGVLLMCLLLAANTAYALDGEVVVDKKTRKNYEVASGQKLTLTLAKGSLRSLKAESAVIVRQGGELLVRGEGEISSGRKESPTLVNYGRTTLEGGALAHENGGTVIDNYGQLYVTGGELDAGEGRAIHNHPGGEVVFAGSAVLRADADNDAFWNTGSAAISGGEIFGSVVSFALEADASMTISGGKITGEHIYAVGAGKESKIEITGEAAAELDEGLGTLLWDGKTFKPVHNSPAAEIEVTGGIFNQPVIFEYLGGSYKAAEREDGTYTAAPLTAEEAAVTATAEDGGLRYFNDLRRAALEAENGSVLKMQKDAAADLELPEGRKMALDFNGRTLTGSIAINGGELSLYAEEGGIRSGGYALDNRSGGTLAIYGGVYGAVRTQSGARLTVLENAVVDNPEGAAVLVDLTGPDDGLTSIVISEKARLTGGQGHHLVEIALPEDADEADYEEILGQIPAAFRHNAAAGVGKPASCTETGLTAGSYCSVCGKVLEAQKMIPALGHTKIVTGAVAPTCTKPGLTAGVHCSVCGEILTQSEAVPALGHTEVETDAIAPTCTKPGLTAGIHCSVCGEILTQSEAVPALGHTEVETDAIAPTCTKPGLTAGVHCSVCGEILTQSEAVPALGHTEVETDAIAPTCTKPGLTAGVHCSVCGEILTQSEAVPALGHTEVETDAVAPTCTKPGLTAGIRCSVCGEILTQSKTIPALGHSAAAAKAVEPTCTASGLTEGSYCDVCGEILTEQTAIPALGHVEVINSETAPTCTEAGLTEEIRCAVCGEVLKERETIPALGHGFGPWNLVKSPTCAEEGESVRVCVRDAGHVEKRVLPATGEHAWDAGAALRQPTAEEEGRRVYTCAVCGAVRSESIPPLDAGDSFEPPDADPEPPDAPEPEPPIVLIPMPEIPGGPDPSLPVPPEEAPAPVLPEEAPVFSDVAPGAWYGEAVDYVSGLGLMTGTSQDEFSPDGKMTRAMLWTVLARM